MSRPPYIRKTSTNEKITELIILLIVIGMIAYAFLTFSKLPKTVPTHIGVTGQVDGYGNKGTQLALGKEFTAGIAILTFLIVLMIVMLIYYIVKMSRQKEI